KLLVAMSRRKLVDRAREHGAARRDFRREQGSKVVENLTSPDHDPAKQAAARELLQEFRVRLSKEERDLADRRALGQRWEQIAAEVGGSPDARRKELARALDRIE